MFSPRGVQERSSKSGRDHLKKAYRNLQKGETDKYDVETKKIAYAVKREEGGSFTLSLDEFSSHYYLLSRGSLKERLLWCTQFVDLSPISLSEDESNARQRAISSFFHRFFCIFTGVSADDAKVLEGMSPFLARLFLVFEQMILLNGSPACLKDPRDLLLSFLARVFRVAKLLIRYVRVLGVPRRHQTAGPSSSHVDEKKMKAMEHALESSFKSIAGGDTKLSYQEFWAFVKSAKAGISQADASIMFQILDASHSRSVSLCEWTNRLPMLLGYRGWDVLSYAFEIVDRSGDGLVDIDEISHFLTFSASAARLSLLSAGKKMDSYGARIASASSSSTFQHTSSRQEKSRYVVQAIHSLVDHESMEGGGVGSFLIKRRTSYLVEGGRSEGDEKEGEKEDRHERKSSGESFACIDEHLIDSGARVLFTAYALMRKEELPERPQESKLIPSTNDLLAAVKKSNEVTPPHAGGGREKGEAEAEKMEGKQGLLQLPSSGNVLKRRASGELDELNQRSQDLCKAEDLSLPRSAFEPAAVAVMEHSSLLGRVLDAGFERNNAVFLTEKERKLRRGMTIARTIAIISVFAVNILCQIPFAYKGVRAPDIQEGLNVSTSEMSILITATYMAGLPMSLIAGILLQKLGASVAGIIFSSIVVTSLIITLIGWSILSYPVMVFAQVLHTCSDLTVIANDAFLAMVAPPRYITLVVGLYTPTGIMVRAACRYFLLIFSVRDVFIVTMAAASMQCLSFVAGMLARRRLEHLKKMQSVMEVEKHTNAVKVGLFASTFTAVSMAATSFSALRKLRKLPLSFWLHFFFGISVGSISSAYSEISTLILREVYNYTSAESNAVVFYSEIVPGIVGPIVGLLVMRLPVRSYLMMVGASLGVGSQLILYLCPTCIPPEVPYVARGMTVIIFKVLLYSSVPFLVTDRSLYGVAMALLMFTINFGYTISSVSVGFILDAAEVAGASTKATDAFLIFTLLCTQALIVSVLHSTLPYRRVFNGFKSAEAARAEEEEEKKEGERDGNKEKEEGKGGGMEVQASKKKAKVHPT